MRQNSQNTVKQVLITVEHSRRKAWLYVVDIRAAGHTWAGLSSHMLELLSYLILEWTFPAKVTKKFPSLEDKRTRANPLSSWTEECSNISCLYHIHPNYAGTQVLLYLMSPPTISWPHIGGAQVSHPLRDGTVINELSVVQLARCLKTPAFFSKILCLFLTPLPVCRQAETMANVLLRWQIWEPDI